MPILLLAFAGAASAEGGYELSFLFGLFDSPESVAVDQATGDVYVVDVDAQTLSRFDAGGRPVAFTAEGSYVSSNELTGTPGGAFSFDSTGAAAQVAIDDSSGPTRGDIYVTDSNNGNVDVFATDGAFLGQVQPGLATPQEGSEPCGVAVDPTGDVYVGHYGGHVDRYTPLDGNPEHDLFDSQLENLGNICNVTVDSAGSVYVSSWPEGALTKYEASQFGSEAPSGTIVDPAVLAAAVDPADDHIFVSERNQLLAQPATQLVELDQTGAVVNTPFGSLVESFGVAVDGASGAVYAPDRSTGKISLFMPPRPKPPTLDGEWATEVTASSAELRAQVHPNLLDTRYTFQYGTDTSYGSGVAPEAAGVDIGAGTEAKDARALLSGLPADTVYHYRVVASNALGTTDGPDHTFTTLAPSNGLALPDDRVWEQVSPLDKNGAEISGLEGIAGGGIVEASPDGSAITYVSLGSFGNPQGAPRGSQYLARRLATEWSTQNITTPLEPLTYGSEGEGGPYKAFSPDLSRGLLINSDVTPAETPLAAAGAPLGYQNYYVREIEDGSLQAVLSTVPAESKTAFRMEVEGATPDLGHVVIRTAAALTPGAVDNGEGNVYEWAGGQLEPVNVLPGGAPAPGARLGSGSFESHDVSDDGAIVYWSRDGALYARENGSRTVQVDAAQGGSGAGGSGIFRTASDDGSKAFFTDRGRLTPDSTAGGVGEDLYEYDSTTGSLSDLTVDPNAADLEGAEVQGVLGASADGSTVYFAAKGSLVDGVTAGVPNLYRWHQGQLTFIAALSPADESALKEAGVANDWIRSVGRRTARVTPDGEHLLFMSSASLTGYDNADAGSGAPDEEVYLYGATTGLVCVSCNPTGARPKGPSSIAAGTDFEVGGELGKGFYQSRALSEDGTRAFFDTHDALVAADSNAQQDVYEYENGHAYLISGGASNEESSFVDASADGSDVFFITAQQLVPTDQDQLVDLYDARENGGFPGPALPSLACSGDGCRPPVSTQPVFGTASTVTGVSSGNVPAPRLKSAAKHKPKSAAKRKPKKAKGKSKKTKKPKRRKSSTVKKHKQTKGIAKQRVRHA